MPSIPFPPLHFASRSAKSNGPYYCPNLFLALSPQCQTSRSSTTRPHTTSSGLLALSLSLSLSLSPTRLPSRLTQLNPSYGTLLGSSIYQSFINGIVSYRALSRPQFSTLQAALTPVYFALQTALPVLMALTYPGVKSLTATEASSLRGLLQEQNRYTVLAPIATICALNAINLLWAGPVTTRIMKERKHQETRDGKKYYDQGTQSKEMQRLNRAFGRMHGVSAVTNLVGLGVTVFYGFLLAERLQ